MAIPKSVRLFAAIPFCAGLFCTGLRAQGTLSSVLNLHPATIYVSATQGSDNWTGKLAAPNSAKTDGPLATFEKARQVVQALHQSGVNGVTVQFRAGTYFLPSTEYLTSVDSGASWAPVVYENYPGETPVISGGIRVTGWTQTGPNKWETVLPSGTTYFENLFYNNQRRLRPRLGGYLGTWGRVGDTVYLPNAKKNPPADPNCSVYVDGSGWECFDRFSYKDPDDPITTVVNAANYSPPPNNPCQQATGDPALIGDIAVLDFEQFSTSKLRLSCVDTGNQIVYMTGPTAMPQGNASEVGFIKNHRYLVENVRNALSQPGQWFFNQSTMKLTLLTMSAQENPNNDMVVIPQLPRLLVTSGLHDAVFRSLTFSHDNFTVPMPLGYVAQELEPNIDAAVSVQNSRSLLFDADAFTQTSASGLEIISCNDPNPPSPPINGTSPSWCYQTATNVTTSDIVVQNSAFFDLGVHGLRIGEQALPADTDDNVPHAIIVDNNVIEGYGRTIPSAFGIGAGISHDSLYTNNDVYDGYHAAISISENLPDNVPPNGHGSFNNTISFNHVYNLLQGIMNDGGSIRVQGGNAVYDAPGNRIWNNKIHDVTDASIQDRDGYGGHGVYMDNSTGLTDVAYNLIYRVSGAAIHAPHGPNFPNQPNTIRNNILAFARVGMLNITFPYADGVPASPNKIYTATNNIFYFDRNLNSPNQPFSVQAGCTYMVNFPALPYTAFEGLEQNLYWRMDGTFAQDPAAFHIQASASTATKDAPCSNNDPSLWKTYTFDQWQHKPVLEDKQSFVRDPHFASPAYPHDDFRLLSLPPIGFVPFDPNLAGRWLPLLNPGPVAPGFPTMTFNPATDY